MGDCLSGNNSPQLKYEAVENNRATQSKIEDVDIVKVKLKTTRDKINNIISAKNRDIGQLDVKINQKVPAYQKTGNKK